MVLCRRASRALWVVAVGAIVAGCGADSSHNPEASALAPAGKGLHEVLPGVRVDLGARIVEFDGEVPIDAHNADGTSIYLEVVVCVRDTREHEALVVTDVRPSDVHAALLLVGLSPGKPGGFRRAEGAPGGFERVLPAGDAVRVEFLVAGAPPTSASDWIINERTNARLDAGASDTGFVFAGSRFVTRQRRERYDADGAGNLVGLHTFGSETIAWRDVLSPEASVEEPVWIADPGRTPLMGTRVTVRITPSPGRTPQDVR